MENLKLSNFLSILLAKKAGTEMFHKCWILYVISVNKITEWLSTNPKFVKIIDKLKLEGIIVDVKDKLIINITNYKKSTYAEFLGEKESMTFNNLFYNFKQKWKGKKGLGKNDRIYLLLSNEKTKVALATFTETNKNISYETILKATEEYLNELERDEDGRYLYAAKSNTFITGNDNNDYLIEYCHSIDNRKKLQKDLKKEYKHVSHGKRNWKDI